MKVRMVSLLLCLLLSFQARSDWCSTTVDSLKWLETANAAEDAASALRANDMRFIGVYGFARSCPGVESCDFSKAMFIEGTSDDLCSDEHSSLNTLAWEYATIYNETIRAAADAS